MTRNRLTAGDVAAADARLALGLETSEQHGHCSTCDSLLLPAAVSVRIAQGDLDAAGGLYRHWNKLARATAVVSGWRWRVRHAANIWLPAATLDDALTSYAEAQAGFQAAGYDYEVARCLLQSAEIRINRRAPGDAEQAEADRAEARANLPALENQLILPHQR